MKGELTITSSGDCLLGGHLLHPGEAPLAAAGQELAGLLARSNPKDLLVLAGGGLGWHARAALDQAQGPQVVIFEPDATRRAFLGSLGPSLEGARVVGDSEALACALSQGLVYGDSGRVAVFAPQAYCQALPELVGQTRQLVETSLARRRCDRQTLTCNQGQWLDNLASNFKYITRWADATLLAGLLPGTPALVVGAGPSLDQSLEHLAGAQGKALVLAAASALGPLARAGVTPHLAVALEGRDESRQFAGADPERTVLAAATSGHHHHFDRWPGSGALFHLQPWVAALTGLGQVLPTGGHATSAAFALALLWGCDPVILVGQDLAFSAGRIHASGRPGGEDEERPPTVSVPDLDGGLIETSEIMRSYIGWYQEAAGFLAAQGSPVELINATAQGALIPGFARQALKQSLEAMPPLPDELASLSGPLGALPRARVEYVSSRLTSARSQVRRCLAHLEMEGLGAALAQAPETSAARAALAGLPDGAGADQAGRSLLAMMTALRGMEEGLYA